MIVCLDRRQPQRGRAQRVAGRKQIFLRPEPSEERHQWTVAHEIGEHFKADILARLSVEPGQTRAMSGESLANLFAHRLLVPAAWLARRRPGLRLRPAGAEARLRDRQSRGHRLAPARPAAPVHHHRRR